jgi:hypothetical protein
VPDIFIEWVLIEDTTNSWYSRGNGPGPGVGILGVKEWESASLLTQFLIDESVVATHKDGCSPCTSSSFNTGARSSQISDLLSVFRISVAQTRLSRPPEYTVVKFSFACKDRRLYMRRKGP